MRTMTIGDLKTRFSEVIQEVKAGEEIAIAFGKKKEVVAYIIPVSARKGAKRTLGVLQNKGTVTFSDDFKMSESELLGL